jgi:hypothetical protein
MTAISHMSLNVSHWRSGVVHRWSRLLYRSIVSTPSLDVSCVSLHQGATHAVTTFNQGLVECLEGCVWLTHDGDCRDVVIDAGQSFVADRDSRLLIHALSGSSIRLVRSV